MIAPTDTQAGRNEDVVPSDENAELWASFKGKERSQTARERLFDLHMGFARSIARRHHREQAGADIEVSDLYQCAYTGLLEALDRFDPERGTPFRAFAAHRISGSVLDGIARASEVREQLSWRRRVRRERVRSLAECEHADEIPAVERLAELALGLALGFMLEGTGLFEDGEAGGENAPHTAYESAAWKETVDHLQAELAALPEREQVILRQHYINGVSFDDLASLMSVSKGRISQLHGAALLLLRRRLRGRGHFRLKR